MDMISKIRETFVRSEKQSLSLRENQIIEGKITKIYPANKAEIQIGNHKLLAEILTPLRVGESYFFLVQAADHIQLKVLREQRGQHTNRNVNVEELLQQLGFKATKINSAFTRELVQDKIPFNQEQLNQSLSLLTNASDKARVTEILKEMIAQRLPLTEGVLQSLAMNRHASLSNLMHQVQAELVQLKSPSDQEIRLMRELETLMVRPVAQEKPSITEKVLANINASSDFLNALKSLGLLDLSVSDKHWEQRTAAHNQGHALSGNLKLPVNDQEAAELIQAVRMLTENQAGIQRVTHRINAILNGLQNHSLSEGTLVQVRQMIEKELLPLLPKETGQMIHQALQEAFSSNPGTITPQEACQQVLNLFRKGGTFQELAAIGTTETKELPKNDSVFLQQSLSEQFLTHLRHYIQTIGLNDEHTLKLHIEHPEQLRAMTTENPSIKSMLLGLLQQHEQGIGDRAQALIHFINGMQMQSVAEVNNLLQASFMLPGGKLELNQDIFMQFEGKKTASGQIDPDFCRIFFVLDLANIKETMIDMHIQKRIISVTIFNDKKEPLSVDRLRPVLKQALEQMDYQLSTVKWKPLYESSPASDDSSTGKEKFRQSSRERYDFLI